MSEKKSSTSSTSPSSSKAPRRVSFGVEGLDDILRGGLPANRLYLVQGDPGVGKTTLALQFLLHGVACGEKVLYVTLSETKEELNEVATAHGWNLDSIHLFELSAAEQRKHGGGDEQTVFDPSEIDLTETMAALLSEVERVNPSRVVFDSLSEVRLLAQTALRYRRQILMLKQFFVGRLATVLLLDDRTSDVNGDRQVQSLAHGVIYLNRLNPGFGATRRQVEVTKLRGVKFRSGMHDYTIETGGLAVFPRLVAAEHRNRMESGTVPSGIPSFDRLVGDGLARGSSALILGPAGAGKTTIGLQFIAAATQRGEHAAVFVFEENVEALIERAAAVSIDLREAVKNGLAHLMQVDPAELSPGEFSALVRRQVDEHDAKVIVIDSLNGYLNSMVDENYLVAQMHDMLAFLSQRGVLTIMIVAQQGLLGTAMQSPVDLTYLADCAVLLRYFEAGGEVRQAISVIKNRRGQNERTIREFNISSTGIQIGEPLRDFVGVLSGIPEYRGQSTPLIAETPERLDGRA